MSQIRVGFAVTALVAVLLPVALQGQDRAESIVEAAAERYRDLATFCADFAQVVENEILGETTRSRGELCQARPDRFEMRFTDPEGDRVVADGRHVWVYFPSTDPGQVFQGDLGAAGGRFDLHQEFLGDPGRRYASTYEGMEDVSGRPAHVLALEPLVASPYLRARIWVDAEDHLIRRAEIVEDEGFTRTLELSAIRLNPEIPAERFEFELPPGVHVIRP
jgi:outer membrane lipoprotein-sorting protein